MRPEISSQEILDTDSKNIIKVDQTAADASLKPTSNSNRDVSTVSSFFLKYKRESLLLDGS